jgi:glycosyltransferase involved in cell wall biosynthesis
MNIGFDAKRIFFNRSGLGNYGRNTIRQLTNHYENEEYHLYTPSYSEDIVSYSDKNIHTITPSGFINKKFKSRWRSYGIKHNIIQDQIEIFHGLSNELPFGIEKTGVKSIVTIHDLIIHRYPELYKTLDVKIYKRKFDRALQEATKVIAISEQTKQDIIQFYGTEEDKIEVVYQGCDPSFYIRPSEDEMKECVTKYNLPSQFLLFVGTIEPRKNALSIVQAIHQHDIDIPLYIIGRSTPYADKIKSYIEKHNLKNIVLLHGVSNHDLKIFYHLAEIFIYPSVFEGFGIPILEALASGTPVISSKGSCFSEAGGENSIYVAPDNISQIAEAILSLLHDSTNRNKLVEYGLRHAAKFTDDKIAKNLMNVYREVL